MKRRRIDIHGHQTSLSVEEEFWSWLCEIAAENGTTRRQLIEDIAASKGQRSLASAVRCYVTAHFQGSPEVYRTLRHMVRARDGGVYVLSPIRRKRKRACSAS